MYECIYNVYIFCIFKIHNVYHGIYMYIYIYICVCVCVYFVYMYVYILYIYIYIYIYIYVYKCKMDYNKLLKSAQCLGQIWSEHK